MMAVLKGVGMKGDFFGDIPNLFEEKCLASAFKLILEHPHLCYAMRTACRPEGREKRVAFIKVFACVLYAMVHGWPPRGTVDTNHDPVHLAKHGKACMALTPRQPGSSNNSLANMV